MRWDELFADLEGQLEDGIGSQEREEQAEEERLQVGRAALRDRLRAIAMVREPIHLRLVDASTIDLAPRTVGRDWLSGDLSGGAQAVLPLGAVAAVLPTAEQLARSREPAPAEGALTDRLGLAFVLRDLARRRRAVQLTTTGGVLTGTLDRVGRDHVDLAVHPADAWRRASAVSRIELLPLASVLLVRVD
ncbi:hypothetical protein [Amnibacterium endophyticum]|uniref:Fis family transcriptional regulator n=1 Tax=Amnibacterium endophyticum TaxID=2109337 RepID=A0ABW4LAW7_9MICO